MNYQHKSKCAQLLIGALRNIVLVSSLFSYAAFAGPFDISTYVLPLDERWRLFVSGYRTFNEASSKRYGDEYNNYVKQAVQALIDGKSYDDFLKILRDGSRAANKAATGKENNGYGKFRTDVEYGGGFSFVYETDGVYDGEKAKRESEIIGDFINFLEAGRDLPGDPDDETVMIVEVAGEGKDRKITVLVSRDLMVTIPNPPKGDVKFPILKHVMNAKFIEDPNGPHKVTVPGVGEVRGTYKPTMIDNWYLITPEQVALVQAYCAKLYATARDKTKPEEAQAAMITIADLLRKAVMFSKGSSGIADALVVAFADYHEWKIGPIREKIGFDIKSWTNPTETVKKDYRTYFDRCAPLDEVVDLKEVDGGGGGSSCKTTVKLLFGS